MRLLLDTHVFLWAMESPERLGDNVALVESPDNDLLVSAVTAWEIAVKNGIGKLPLPEPVESYVPSLVRWLGAQKVAVEHAHALAVAGLPPVHRDPFDRLLIAQAIALEATLMTSDARLAAYPAQTILV